MNPCSTCCFPLSRTKTAAAKTIYDFWWRLLRRFLRLWWNFKSSESLFLRAERIDCSRQQLCTLDWIRSKKWRLTDLLANPKCETVVTTRLNLFRPFLFIRAQQRERKREEGRRHFSSHPVTMVWKWDFVGTQMDQTNLANLNKTKSFRPLGYENNPTKHFKIAGP